MSSNDVSCTIKKLAEQFNLNPLYIVFFNQEISSIDWLNSIANDLGLSVFASSSESEILNFIEIKQNQIIYIIASFKEKKFDKKSIQETTTELYPEIPFTALSEKSIEKEKLIEIIEKDTLTRIQAIQDDRELLEVFLAESENRLNQAEDLALALENNPQDLETINHCFGLVHTLKGSSGFFKPKTLHQFIHRFEDILKSIQKGEIQLDETVVSSILISFDFIKKLLYEFKKNEHKRYHLEEVFSDFFKFNKKQKKINEEKIAEPKKISKEKKSIEEIRVPVTLLDEFMRTSGEITVIRNMINKCFKSIENQFQNNKDITLLASLLTELHKLTLTTQSQIVSLKKIPLSNIIKPVYRVIRDLSKTLSKQIELIVLNEELSIDTTIATVLNDSIVHLIRNSLDHGIESPEIRIQRGKLPKGKISVSGEQKNEIIYIKIKDDGDGISEEKIKNKLIANGTHTPEQTEKMSKNQLYNMIFSPGFSTADKITDISGRGIGMSFVKESVESIGGRIEIDSISHQGTQFTLILPVPKSVLIRDCLFILSSGMCFGIPQDDIIKVIKINPENSSELCSIEDTYFLNYHETLIPVISLNHFLKINPESHSKSQEIFNFNYLVLIEHQKNQLALAVDEVLDIEDTVVKKTEGPVRKLKFFQGAAFLGDSSIALVLSTEDIFYQSHIANTKATLHPPVDKKSHLEVIIFKLSLPEVFVIPKKYVLRIELIYLKNLSFSGGLPVTPYRGEIIPIIDLEEALLEKNTDQTSFNAWTERGNETDYFIVFIIKRDHPHSTWIGLKVNQIEDISSLSSPIERQLYKQFGILGSALLQDQRISHVLDIEEILDVFTGNP